MALNSWVDVSFGVPVLEEPRVHCRFGFQLLNKALDPKTAVNWFQNDPQMVPKVAWKATGGQLVRLMWTRLPLERALDR